MNIENLLDLARELECTVMCAKPLSEHTTFKIGGKCLALIDVTSVESLQKLFKEAKSEGIPVIVLGKGSNLLFDDRGYNGVVFHLDGAMDDIYMKSERVICAQAGCSLIKLCRFALEHSLSGLEFAYGIPGSVGGAIFMNAGAYGGEIKDVIKSCKAVFANGEVKTFNNSGMDLGYRQSCFQHNDSIIVEGEFELLPGNYDDIQDKMVELMGKRRQKQPLEYPSAGSAFKRPQGQFAGKLIDDCGLRGFSVGGAKISSKHCGFIINTGGATSKDVLELISQVRCKVYEKTGVNLEPEIKYIPYEE